MVKIYFTRTRVVTSCKILLLPAILGSIYVIAIVYLLLCPVFFIHKELLVPCSSFPLHYTDITNTNMKKVMTQICGQSVKALHLLGYLLFQDITATALECSNPEDRVTRGTIVPKVRMCSVRLSLSVLRVTTVQQAPRPGGV